jgi:hypothetical protein
MKNEETHDERLVMVLDLAYPTIGSVGGHQNAETPFVDRVGVFLEERWRDEGLEHEPAAKVDARRYGVERWCAV